MNDRAMARAGGAGVARQQRAALLRLAAGMTLISFSPVWVTLTAAEPTTSAFYRLAIGGAVLALWVWWRGERLWHAGPVLLLLLAAGVFFTLDLFFWHRSILYVGSGLSTLLANFQIFILILVAWLWHGQRPRGLQLVSIPIALFGLVLIVGLDFSMLSAEYRLGIAFGLLTAVCYAGYILGLQAARLRADAGASSPMREVAVASLVGAVGLALLSRVTGESLAIPSVADAGLLTVYALGSTVLGWVLIASSMRLVPAAQLGLVLLLQPVLAFLWDVLFFGRGFTAGEAGGALIALTAIYLGTRAYGAKR